MSGLDQQTFRKYLQQSLSQVFGKIGGAVPFEVLSVQQSNTVVFLKTDKRCAPTPTSPNAFSSVQGWIFDTGSLLSKWHLCHWHAHSGTFPSSGLHAH